MNVLVLKFKINHKVHVTAAKRLKHQEPLACYPSYYKHNVRQLVNTLEVPMIKFS